MIELEQVSSSAEQKFEYVARLLAVTEQYTERLRGLTEEFGNLIHHAYPGHDYDDLMSAVDAAVSELTPQEQKKR